MSDQTLFEASNGVTIRGGEGLFLRDPDAGPSEARMMTIQPRKMAALREFFQRSSAPQTIHVQKPISDISARIRVPFAIDRRTAGTSVTGHTDVIESGDRVCIETMVNGRIVCSNMLNPTYGENDFDVLRAEVMHIVPFQMPLTSRSAEAAAAVMHAYVSAGRPGWG